MNIKIGKSDIAALGCEGCIKKFVCNIANNSKEDKNYIENKLNKTLPKMDPPAIMNEAGNEGEKGCIVHLINNNNSKTVFFFINKRFLFIH